MSSFRSGVEDGAAVKQLRAIRARQFAPKCDCSVLTEWGVCKRPKCFDWDATPPAPHVGGGMRIRCHMCGTVRCSANCGLLICNCCEHDHGNFNADYNGEIRDALEELLDASPDASCTLQELHGSLLQRGDYGKMQVPLHRQWLAGCAFPRAQVGAIYWLRLDELRNILSIPEDTGAGLFPPGHPDSKLHSRSAYSDDLFIVRDDVLHHISPPVLQLIVKRRAGGHGTSLKKVTCARIRSHLSLLH